ncbi:MAG: hypothetical protein N2200_02845, partial [Bacteroidia bacterium]|nr:hypothetical protein [Bacteroidia bacterium]
MTEENAHYPVGQLAERLHRLGWDMGWGSNRDSIFLTAEGLTENLSSALGLLYEAVAYPTLSGPAVSHHLNRLIEAETRSRANPTYQADATLQHYLWGQSYRITAYESIETLRRIDTTLLTSYYEHFIRKGLNGVVIAAPYLPESLYKWSAWIGSVAYTCLLYTS